MAEVESAHFVPRGPISPQEEMVRAFYIFSLRFTAHKTGGGRIRPDLSPFEATLCVHSTMGQQENLMDGLEVYDPACHTIA